MNIALMLVPLLVQYGPNLVAEIVSLWKTNDSPEVQLQKWEALLQKLQKSYDEYIAEAGKTVTSV